MEQAIEKESPTPPEKEVEDKKEEEKNDEDLECEQLSPMDVDKVVVNAVDLTKDSTLATLRAAFSFLGISGSGSKQRSMKILNRNKKMELLNAKKLGE